MGLNERMQVSEARGKRLVPLSRDQLGEAAWRASVTVRFRHCDPAGIVFTPRYFDILNETVERFFVERLGIDYYALIGERKLGLGYATAACDFLQPNRMGDVLDVAVLVERVGGASYTLALPVLKSGTEVARGRLVTVTTSLETHRSCAIPDDLRAALLAYHEACRPVLELLSAGRE